MIALPELLDGLRAIVPREIKVYYWAAQGIYLNPWFWGFTAGILVLEKLWPADRSQRVFSWGLLQDFTWFNADAAFKVALLPAFAGAMRMLYDAITGHYEIEMLAGSSVAVRIIAAFVVFDFLQWFHHWARHKVKAFWYFHAIHHSQREMNVFTDLRAHTVEYVIAEVLVFVPLFALGLPALAVMGVASLRWWYTRFIHANIRTNLGPLKYVLVTPQFHRVHHSIEPQHQDKNFGVVLSVWDRMFGTLHPGYDEYPATGVEGFPAEPPHRFAPGAWVKDYVRLFIRPFRELVQRRPAPLPAVALSGLSGGLGDAERQHRAAHRHGELLPTLHQVGDRRRMDAAAGAEGPDPAPVPRIQGQEEIVPAAEYDIAGGGEQSPHVLGILGDGVGDRMLPAEDAGRGLESPDREPG